MRDPTLGVPASSARATVDIETPGFTLPGVITDQFRFPPLVLPIERTSRPVFFSLAISACACGQDPRCPHSWIRAARDCDRDTGLVVIL
jgi:hypothetical protein